jgi:hypothetical protein
LVAKGNTIMELSYYVGAWSSESYKDIRCKEKEALKVGDYKTPSQSSDDSLLLLEAGRRLKTSSKFSESVDESAEAWEEALDGGGAGGEHVSGGFPPKKFHSLLTIAKELGISLLRVRELDATGSPSLDLFFPRWSALSLLFKRSVVSIRDRMAVNAI